MSRWFAMLEKSQHVIAPVQNVQFVQNEDVLGCFERSEHSEQQMAEKITPVSLELDPDAWEERAALIEANGVPKEWSEGFAALCTMPRPSAYAIERWEQLLNDGGLFLDKWGDKAAALGWKASDIFGVDPRAPEIRYDAMGLVPALEGRSVIAITTDTARIDCGKGGFQTFNRETTGLEASTV